MQVRVRTECRICSGKGIATFSTVSGMSTRDDCPSCYGSGWEEDWIIVPEGFFKLYGMVVTNIDIGSLHGRVIQKQCKRIEHLESIILEMSKGVMTSFDEFTQHDHFVQPVAATDLVGEIKGEYNE